MKTFIRTKLPDSIIYDHKCYTFFSALDREGYEAVKQGVLTIKVRIDNNKRRKSRRIRKKTNGNVLLMKYDNPTDYYYTVKTDKPRN
jgi:hypothetical protein